MNNRQAVEFSSLNSLKEIGIKMKLKQLKWVDNKLEKNCQPLNNIFYIELYIELYSLYREMTFILSI